MKQNVKEKWLAALRSGEYKQGKFCLKQANGGGYCCLGVLCEVAVKENILPPPIKDENGDMSYGRRIQYSRPGEISMLPKEVQDWAGLTRSPVVDTLHGVMALTRLNDIENHSFEQLAELIEHKLVIEEFC